ncbi:hypothetical protein [Stenotrophomonas maltophilia]|uniref:hypothetical protein n=1 Tax=Stenotrophomonas maltophilia TaxID=40324 RepID=UPI002402DA31|nr:hypothetical protein [Stenotrophomonas maltophilia]
MTKERPILFNGTMVRAILAGAKTQTRRVVKPQPVFDTRFRSRFRVDGRGSMSYRQVSTDAPAALLGEICPFGKPGDRLWVRETWMDLKGTGIEHWDPATGQPTRYAYGADSPPGSASDEARKDFGLKWRPSIHMPRWACRLVLEITDVRVEPLQAISKADAITEGLTQTEAGGWLPGPCDHPEWAFHQLWNQVYGESSWDSNPWVWAITFKRIEA